MRTQKTPFLRYQKGKIKSKKNTTNHHNKKTLFYAQIITIIPIQLKQSLPQKTNKKSRYHYRYTDNNTRVILEYFLNIILFFLFP